MFSANPLLGAGNWIARGGQLLMIGGEASAEVQTPTATLTVVDHTHFQQVVSAPVAAQPLRSTWSTLASTVLL